MKSGQITAWSLESVESSEASAESPDISSQKIHKAFNGTSNTHFIIKVKEDKRRQRSEQNENYSENLDDYSPAAGSISPLHLQSICRLWL